MSKMASHTCLECHNDFVYWNLHHPHRGQPSWPCSSSSCLRARCCRTSFSETFNGSHTSVFLIQTCLSDRPVKSQLQKNMHPHHIICSMPQNPWECSSNLTLKVFVFFRRESKALIKSCVAV